MDLAKKILLVGGLVGTMGLVNSCYIEQNEGIKKKSEELLIETTNGFGEFSERNVELYKLMKNKEYEKADSLLKYNLNAELKGWYEARGVILSKGDRLSDSVVKKVGSIINYQIENIEKVLE